MAARLQLPLSRSFRSWLMIGSATAISTGVFYVYLLVAPLVVFQGDFLSGSVAITWYDLKNYGEPVYHPGLSSIPFLSIITFCTVFFSMGVGIIVFRKALRQKTIGNVAVELLIGSLEALMIFTGIFVSLRLNVMHAVQVLPTEAGGTGSAGILVVPGSTMRETFPSMLIKQFLPLTFLGVLLVVVTVIIALETIRSLEALENTGKGKYAGEQG